MLVAGRPWGFDSLRPHHNGPAAAGHELAVFAAGVTALVAAAETVLALVFAVLVLVHLSLTFVLAQRPR